MSAFDFVKDPLARQFWKKHYGPIEARPEEASAPEAPSVKRDGITIKRVEVKNQMAQFQDGRAKKPADGITVKNFPV